MNIEIEISGEKSVVKNVPETTWEALKPFWPPIVKAIIEVFLEGDFKPYDVRKDRKDGFYAGEWYWNRSSIDSEEYPLKEAKKFIEMLLEKKCFVESIKEFNKPRQVNWTENIKQLRQFIYKTCFPLEEFLRSLKVNQ